MTPITCVINTLGFIRISPALPAGLKYSVTASGGSQTVTISGKPMESLAPRNFYIGFNLWMSTITISSIFLYNRLYIVFGPPTKCSYGFDQMVLYTGIIMEPIPIKCNTAMTSFSISPVLPNGMLINAQTGVISGTLQQASSDNTTYTVTATNTYGSVTTHFSFRALDAREMTTLGMTGCYWAEVTECLTPDFSFFYSKPAQICQIVNNIDFTDNYDYTSWPGLDSRFVDYFAAYFYGYMNILVAGTYQIAMNADDGAMLFVDDINTPVIDVPGCWATTITSKDITLTQGYHLIIVRYFEYNDGATLFLKLGSTELSIPFEIINTSVLRVGGRGPTFISYDFVSGYANTNLPVVKPELNSGAPHTWTISSLPTGLAFDTNNGYISGIPSSASSGTYTVTATSVNGVASTVVRIVITDAPIEGILSKYYKIIDANHCLYPSLKGNVVRLQSVQVDSTINHPESEASFLWPNTPSDFTTYYYVEWEGYLKMDVTGLWKLRLTCASGCKLYGADDQLLISHWGCHTYSSKDVQYPVSKSGYYYFRVEYAQNQGNKGIVFEWQAPNSELIIVPAANMYYLPSGVLSYKYQLAHYFKNKQIETNTPVNFAVTTFTDFHVTPDLPTGLSISQTTGYIQGMPSQEQVVAYYTITATTGGKTESTVIGIDVSYVLPPEGIQMKQGGTLISTGSTVTLIPLRPITSIQMQVPAGVHVNSYSISPTLPEGLEFDTKTGTISGKPLVQANLITYTIAAMNSGGTNFLLLRLTVGGCKGRLNGQEWTNDFYIVSLSSGQATFDVRQQDTVIQCSVNEMGADGYALDSPCSTVITAGSQAVFCVPPNSLNRLHLSCTDRFGCYWQIRKQDGNRFPTKLAYHPTNPPPYVADMMYPSLLTPLTSLTITPDDVEVFSGYVLPTITIQPNGCYKTIEITPSLGNSASIPLMKPVLQGTVYGKSKQVYTITAKGDAGTASATLTLLFKECSAEEGYETVTFTKITTNYGTEESYTVRQDTTSLLTRDNLENNAVYNDVLCLLSGIYTITLYDDYGDGWANGSLLKVSGSDNHIIQSYTFPNHSGSTNYKEMDAVLAITVVVPEKEVWKGLINGRPNKKWKNVGEDISDFSDFTSGIIGTWSEPTIYFVRDFTIDDVLLYPIVEFGIYYKDGLIVYLNGNEVYRRNLPTSSIQHSTYAIASYDDYYLRVGSAPGYLLQVGTNRIAVEIHRLSNTQGDIQWKGYIKYNRGSCITRIDSGFVTESGFYNKDTETAIQAWDRNLNTKWVENGLPAWTTYSYNFDRMEWVNKLVIGSTDSNPDQDPTKINVYGTTDGVQWDLIKAIESKAIFTARGQTVEFMMMNHLNSYSKYKIEFTETKNKDKVVGISYLDLLACPLIYCTKDGDFPGTIAGQSVTIDCAEGFIGERYRKCGTASFKPAWEPADETECRSINPPKKVTYIDWAYVISDITYEDTISNNYAENIRAIVSTIANQETKRIEVWKIKDITDIYKDEAMKDQAKVAVYVRITLPNEEAQAAFKAVMASVDTVQRNLHLLVPEVFENTRVAFYILPQLNQTKNLSALSVGLIIILVIVVLIISAIIGFWIWVRTKDKGKKNGAKKLRSGMQKGKSSKSKTNRV